MKVYCLVGKSGTGKSFQAINLCRKLNIESIIDDGLFICHNKVMAGISAKRQPTKFRAVTTALFTEDWHAEEVIAKISEEKPKSILVLGTSDRMVDKIMARLQLEEPIKRVYIEEITTEEERDIAYKQRHEQGQHVIPAPTFQLKKQFSGYFMSPMKMFKDFGSRRDSSEKSVVRPSYSYLGKYNISERVMTDIVECISEEIGTVYDIIRVIVSSDQFSGEEGLEILITANFRYGKHIPAKARDFQEKVINKIELMTAFNVNRVDIEVRDIIFPEVVAKEGNETVCEKNGAYESRKNY